MPLSRSSANTLSAWPSSTRRPPPAAVPVRRHIHVRRMPAHEIWPAFRATSWRLKAIRRLVTAGHIILNIESALKNGSVRIVRSNLIDCFGAGAKYFHPYHFPYEKEERYYEDDKDTRTDFGFISIPPLICRNLEANKIVPVDWRNWMSQESGDFEAFFMLGLPTELMKKQLAEPGSRGMSHVSLTPVMIPVQSWIPSRRIISLIPFHPSHERSRRKFGESKPNKAKNPRTCIHRLERSRHEGKDHVSSHARRYRLRR